jgi:hypothetical protein
MTWYITAKTKLSQKDINSRLKKIIKSNKFFVDMFNAHSVPLDRVDDHLTFEVKELDGKKAQSDSKTIILNKKIIEKGDFFENGLHYVVHELHHWLTRQKEKNFYFADPEEIDAFSMGMAYEILRGKKAKEISEIYRPIIEDHFSEEQDAKKLLKVLFYRAKEKAKQLR